MFCVSECCELAVYDVGPFNEVLCESCADKDKEAIWVGDATDNVRCDHCGHYVR